MAGLKREAWLRDVFCLSSPCAPRRRHTAPVYLFLFSCFVRAIREDSETTSVEGPPRSWPWPVPVAVTCPRFARHDCAFVEQDALGRAGKSPPEQGEIPVRGEGTFQAFEFLSLLVITCLDLLPDISRLLQEGPVCVSDGPREEVAFAHEYRGFLRCFPSHRSTLGEAASKIQGARGKSYVTPVCCGCLWCPKYSWAGVSSAWAERSKQATVSTSKILCA
nr:PREDICTED: uncharacterized protein LOC104148201 [Struthio camelus australis]